MRHYEVQMIGGYILHKGMISEMVTGEGKTLVATLPAFLNALAGKVHVVTVNDYLARRDMEWMGPVYLQLGLTVGAIQSNMNSAERQVHYACDITYGTSNQFGFDYLRDNMKPTVEQQVQGPLDYAIVDEIDNILIDEARTPLIISGPAHDNLDKYPRAEAIARQLRAMSISKSRKRSTPVTSPKPESAAPNSSQVSTASTPPATWNGRTCLITHSKPTTSTSATFTTSSKNRKSSSSTKTPAAKWKADSGQTDFTRQSKPKKVSASKPRRKLWPLSLCRTTSSSTASFRE
jgi:hypothetical protein